MGRASLDLVGTSSDTPADGPVTVYSYVVRWDYGFAPNPFHGYCTLATCKPRIRAKAVRGDWVVGTGSKERELDGRLVYAMKVSEVLTFQEYWSDDRFLCKRPILTGSLKQVYGDNIYHRSSSGGWIQEDSHHSRAGGKLNEKNLRRDTQTDRVLIGVQFVYWGGQGPALPRRLRSFKGVDLCHQSPGHKCVFPAGLQEALVQWLERRGEWGCVGEPGEYARARRTRD